MDHSKDIAKNFEGTLNALLLNARELSSATSLEAPQLTHHQNELLDTLFTQWNTLPDNL